MELPAICRGVTWNIRNAWTFQKAPIHNFHKMKTCSHRDFSVVKRALCRRWCHSYKNGKAITHNFANSFNWRRESVNSVRAQGFREEIQPLTPPPPLSPQVGLPDPACYQLPQWVGLLWCPWWVHLLMEWCLEGQVSDHTVDLWKHTSTILHLRVLKYWYERTFQCSISHGMNS